MKTQKISEAYRTINAAKLTKMEDKEKFIVIKAMRVLKPISASFEEFINDAREKLKGEQFDNMQQKARQWQEEGEKTSLTPDERKQVNTYFNEYTQRVNECVREEADKEHELPYDRLSEEAFGRFIASNDYDVATIMELQEVLV